MNENVQEYLCEKLEELEENFNCIKWKHRDS